MSTLGSGQCRQVGSGQEGVDLLKLLNEIIADIDEVIMITLVYYQVSRMLVLFLSPYSW